MSPPVQYRTISGHTVLVEPSFLPHLCSNLIEYSGKGTPKIRIFKANVFHRMQLIDYISEVNKEPLHYLDPQRKHDLTYTNLVSTEGYPSKFYVSKYRGVSYDSRRKKWIAQLYWKGCRRFYRRFDTEVEAANFYNSGIRIHDAPTEWLNTIELKPPSPYKLI